jgi:hypothetical protein
LVIFYFKDLIDSGAFQDLGHLGSIFLWDWLSVGH